VREWNLGNPELSYIQYRNLFILSAFSLSTPNKAAMASALAAKSFAGASLRSAVPNVPQVRSDLSP